MQRLNPYLMAARPHQWLKNLLVFAAPLAAGEIENGNTILRTSVAAFLFLLVSISVYFFNDLCDVEADKQHAQKAQRPIAKVFARPGIDPGGHGLEASIRLALHAAKDHVRDVVRSTVCVSALTQILERLGPVVHPRRRFSLAPTRKAMRSRDLRSALARGGAANCYLRRRRSVGMLVGWLT